MVPIGIEEAGENEGLLVNGQFGCRYLSQCPVEIFGTIINEIDQLLDQRWGQIKGRFHAGMLVNEFCHIQIVLRGMRPHPGAGVDTVFVFVIKRLVLMPGQVNI